MASRKRSASGRMAEIDALIDEIITDAEDEIEQLWAFRQQLEDSAEPPCAGTVLGEPVTVIEFDFDGNLRRGVTAKCRRADGRKFTLAAVDVELAHQSPGAFSMEAYRRWMGISPAPRAKPRRQARPAKAIREEPVPMDPGVPVDLAVLSCGPANATCRIVATGETIVFRGRTWELYPGAIATLKPAKRWTYGNTAYVSGELEGVKFDAKALGLVPLRLERHGDWDPEEEEWRDKDYPPNEWERAVIAWGTRPRLEMEQVLPGRDPDIVDSDPVGDAVDLMHAGDGDRAEELLMGLCRADLRCLDAHAHLGLLLFDYDPARAIRHYEAGVRIADLSFGDNFDGALPWSLIDNRPFFRCLHGYGLCLWRLGRFEEAERAFKRMLWLNPADNQGARFLIEDVKNKLEWTAREHG